MAIMAPAHKQFWMNPRLGLWVDLSGFWANCTETMIIFLTGKKLKGNNNNNNNVFAI
jgi:hypothetical protein